MEMPSCARCPQAFSSSHVSALAYLSVSCNMGWTHSLGRCFCEANADSDVWMCACEEKKSSTSCFQRREDGTASACQSSPVMPDCDHACRALRAFCVCNAVAMWYVCCRTRQMAHVDFKARRPLENGPVLKGVIMALVSWLGRCI